MILLEIGIQYRVLIGISAMVLLFSSFLVAFVSNQRKKIKFHKDILAIQEEQQKALMEQNLLLEVRVKERTAELSIQKENLLNTLSDLKKSQLQVIQSEKMASLGEMASGIAHEIQNPLNFVINFSDASSDMILEMKELIKNQEFPDSLREEMELNITDLEGNLKKIAHHGKRADNIVKSMLQHARIRGGIKEDTDLNALIDEYLKLCYLTFKKVHKEYECALNHSYDEGIKTIKIIPQDIGSLLFNLLSNAFYSTKEKLNKNIPHYMPMVSVISVLDTDSVEIKVRDNGMGIHPKLIEKIYQPFFTTKPAGEGTGLGLSISYDIVKSHQGDMKVYSIEGEFAEFIITLPLN